MKYVMFRVSTTLDIERDVPIIFPNSLVHADIAKRIVRAVNDAYGTDNAKVISAGEISLFDGVACGGRSQTLKVGSRPEDSRIIRMHDYSHGIV